jgi:hypothetical protein
MRDCSATSKRTGQPCKAQALAGTTLCYWHGGATPHNRALSMEAKERMQIAKQALALGLDVPESVDPRDALAAELCRAVGEEAVLRTLVRALDLTEGGLYRERD